MPDSLASSGVSREVDLGKGDAYSSDVMPRWVILVCLCETPEPGSQSAPMASSVVPCDGAGKEIPRVRLSI